MSYLLLNEWSRLLCLRRICSWQTHHKLGLCRIVISSLIINTSESNLQLEPLPPSPPFDCYVFVWMSGNGQAQSSTINTIIDDVMTWDELDPSHCQGQQVRPRRKHPQKSPQSPSPIVDTFFECYECVGGDRGRTSHLPVAVFGDRIHRHHGFSKKPVKTNTLVSQYLPLTSKRYKSLLHGVEKGFVCLQCWRLGDGFIFNGCVWRYKKGCSALLVPPVWDDTYLSSQVEIDQAQHTNGNVRSRSTRWHYRSGLKTISL